MGVKLVSSSGGSVEINPPVTASNFTATMPAGTGTVAVNGASGVLVSATAQASTSGTSIDFTSIPSWVKRITVMFSGVSTNGSSGILIQFGDSGGIENTGYVSGSVAITNGAVGTLATSTAGIVVVTALAAADTFQGNVMVGTLGTNIWSAGGSVYRASVGSYVVAGSKTLSDTLTQVRITTINGTDTFDAGTINIMYE